MNFGELYSVHFSLDSNSIAYPVFTSLFETDSGYYYSFLNGANNSIYTYSLANRQASNVFKIPYEGPIGHRVSAYHFKRDTLFTVSNLNKSIILSLKGQLVKRFNVDYFYNQSYPVLPFVKGFSPILAVENKVYIGGTPDKLITKSDWKESRLLMKFENGQIDYEGAFPAAYLKSRDWSIYQTAYSFDVKNDTIFLSFPISEYVYQSVNGHVVDSILIKSKEKVTTDPLSTKHNEMNEAIAFLKETAFYEGIKYDQYKKLLYRVFSVPKEKIINGEPRIVPEKRLLVYDLNMKTTKELVLKGAYNFNNSFVTNRGVFIQKINSNDEDHHEFTLFGEPDRPLMDSTVVVPKKLVEKFRSNNVKRVFILSAKSCNNCIKKFLEGNIVFDKNDILLLTDCEENSDFVQIVNRKMTGKLKIELNCNLKLLVENAAVEDFRTPILIDLENDFISYL
jgi:hypothetical protein